ncbi:ATP-binding protein [Natrinema sp. CGMCC1.2065]|uniref:ATP-binding protein n=1 Tax=Natrinema sp. CGMCC1.2065 TaxID=3445767 RepID=UPI003F4A37DA
MSLRAGEVFRDANYPEYTYVRRRDGDVEDRLADYLFKEEAVVSISGPSKSGKSTIVRHVVQNYDRTPDYIVEVRGNNIDSGDDFWKCVLKELGEPTSRHYESRQGTREQDRFTIGAAIQALTAKYSTSTTEEDFDVIVEDYDLGLSTILDIYNGEYSDDDETPNDDFVIFVDDAHKIPDSVHTPVAENIKEGLDKGLKFCIGYIDYRSDALTAADIDLAERVESVELQPWKTQELSKIARKGFDALEIEIDDSVIRVLAEESIQSPQLMQKLCYKLCTNTGYYFGDNDWEVMNVDEEFVIDLLEEVAGSIKTQYKTEFDILTGKARGKSKKPFEWIDGNSGNRYLTLLRGIAQNPPGTSLSLEDLRTRIYSECRGDGPEPGNITNDVIRISKWIDKSANTENFVFDYVEDREKEVQIPEPGIIFCLRWSDVIGFQPNLQSTIRA